MKIVNLILIAILSVFFYSCDSTNEKEKNKNTAEVEYFKVGDLYYHVVNGSDSKVEIVADTASSVKSYTGLRGDLIIPETVEYNSRKYKVWFISDSLFAGCNELSTLTVSDGVKFIGARAFEGCSSLKSVKLPENLVSLGERAFINCEKLKSVTIPQGLKEIKANTFYGCSDLENVIIPASVERVGQGAFEETAWLRKHKDEVVYAGNVAYAYRSSSFSGTIDISLKDGTVGISEFVFLSHPEIRSVVIPATVKYIGMSAFLNCKGLKSVNIPEGVKTIEKNAFCMCENLESVIFPESLEFIGDRAFEGCNELRTLRIPRKVRKIGEDAFKSCSSLTEIIVDNPNPILFISGFSAEMLHNVTLIVPNGAIEAYKSSKVWKDFENIVEKELR